MKNQINRLLLASTLTLLLVFARAGLADVLEDHAKNDVTGLYAIEYTYKNPNDGSKETMKAWEDHQTYDLQLSEAGKISLSGRLSTDDGYPEKYFLFLRKMKWSEAKQIIDDDPIIKAGIVTGRIRLFSPVHPSEAMMPPHA